MVFHALTFAGPEGDVENQSRPEGDVENRGLPEGDVKNQGQSRGFSTSPEGPGKR